jgi:hypothetical protein
MRHNHRKPEGLLKFRRGNEEFSTNADVSRARSLPASHRRSLLASPHLAPQRRGAARSQAISRCSDVAGPTGKESLRLSPQFAGGWKTTGTTPLLLSGCRLKWVAWRRTQNSQRCCAKSSKHSDDPFVIAECLARPVLAERLTTNLYAHAQRIHGEVKVQPEYRRASADNRAPYDMAAASASYSLPAISDRPDGCSDETWTTISTINAPAPRASHTAVWTGSEMIVWGGTVAPI